MTKCAIDYTTYPGQSVSFQTALHLFSTLLVVGNMIQATLSILLLKMVLVHCFERSSTLGIRDYGLGLRACDR